MCGFSYYLNYILGLKDPGKIKTHIGSISHKALELVARRRLAIQNGESTFSDQELDKTWDCQGFDEHIAHQEGWDFYTKKLSQFNWTSDEFELSKQYVTYAMAFKDGMFNPDKRIVVEPEQYFDITIDRPWAYFDYKNPFGGDNISGQLSIKGTMDLLVDVEDMPNTYELCDWKTGLRLDWANGKVKDYQKLRRDPQLMLYHYALCHLYPDIDQFIVTIFYLKHFPNSKKPEEHGGPFSVYYTRDELHLTEKMLEKRFNEIRSTYFPKQRKTWRCKAFCHFGRTKAEGSDDTICEHMHKELKQEGMDAMIRKYGDEHSLVNYSEGGGRTHTKKENS